MTTTPKDPASASPAPGALHSMTGFGRAQGKVGDREVSVEVAAVNHKNLEVALYMPSRWSRFELPLRRQVGAAVSRGKLRVSVRAAASGEGGAAPMVFSPQAVETYLDAHRKLQDQLGCDQPLSAARLLFARGVVQPCEDADTPGDEAEGEQLEALTGRALEALKASRAREGESLARDLGQRAEHIRALVGRLEEALPALRQALRERYEARLADLLGDLKVSEERMLTEVTLYLEKTDVHEEMVRLRHHAASLDELLAKGGACGRRLGFVGQEMNREANTLGAKSFYPDVGDTILALKDEVAKIREQVENVE